MSTHMAAQNKASFPAMTFCAVPYGYKDDVLLKHGIANKWVGYCSHTKGVMNWTSSNSSVSETKLFKIATFAIDELVEEVTIRLFKAKVVGPLGVLHKVKAFLCEIAQVKKTYFNGKNTTLGL